MLGICLLRDAVKDVVKGHRWTMTSGQRSGKGKKLLARNLLFGWRLHQQPLPPPFILGYSHCYGHGGGNGEIGGMLWFR